MPSTTLHTEYKVVPTEKNKYLLGKIFDKYYANKRTIGT